VQTNIISWQVEWAAADTAQHNLVRLIRRVQQPLLEMPWEVLLLELLADWLAQLWALREVLWRL
jgi:hypothetical protein